ncbi:hypothetical protein BCR39DRAFT_558932 [Naematelia encephala]|uniref:Uncharacterized protein n=1 Tax=Naematelia encephala TaxID=71784 RepID=A0A1Y2B501_9TREE|nr:hypothetical protein BCR39DRAFT_558932 [Naematelia encephala]
MVYPTKLVVRPTTPVQPAIQITPHKPPQDSQAALMNYIPLHATALVPSPRPSSGPAHPAPGPLVLIPKTSGSRARKIFPAGQTTNTPVISYHTQADPSTPYLIQSDTPTTFSRALLAVPHLSPSSSSGSSLHPGLHFGDGSFACLATIMDLPRPVALARTDQDQCYTLNEISSGQKLDLIWAVLRDTSRLTSIHTDLSKGGE